MLFDFEFDFDWDPAKSDRCLRERGFDFEFAAGVFADGEAFPGPSRWAEDELRFTIIGRTVTGDRLLVVFCWRLKVTKKSLSAASSQPVTYVRKSMAGIKRFAKSPEAKAMGEALKKRGGPTAADLRDIPEITDEEWAALKAARRKRPVTVRLDGDIVTWLKGKEGKYQQHLNRLLRFAMQQEQTKAASTAAAKRKRAS